MKAKEDIIVMKGPWKCQKCSYEGTVFCKVINGTAESIDDCDGPFGRDE